MEEGEGEVERRYWGGGRRGEEAGEGEVGMRMKVKRRVKVRWRG